MLGSEDLASTIDTLQKRISAFQAQAEVAASTDNPTGELRRSRRLLPLIGYPPCFPLSTGDLPAASPPHGADQTTVDHHVVQAEADDAVIGLEAPSSSRVKNPGGDPLVTSGTERGGRAGRVGDRGIRAAEHEDLDELVEHDPIRNPGPMTTPRDWVSTRSGISAANWLHTGSRMNDGTAGTSTSQGKWRD